MPFPTGLKILFLPLTQLRIKPLLSTVIQKQPQCKVIIKFLIIYSTQRFIQIAFCFHSTWYCNLTLCDALLLHSISVLFFNRVINRIQRFHHDNNKLFYTTSPSSHLSLPLDCCLKKFILQMNDIANQLWI